MKKPSYRYRGRDYFRKKGREEQLLRRLGFARNRQHRGRHSPRVYFSGPLSLPVDWGSNRVGAIHIRRPFGRFGNQFLQLVHALALSERLRSLEIIAPGNTAFSDNPLDQQVGGIRLRTDPALVEWELDKKGKRRRGIKSELHLSYNTFFAEHSNELSTPLSPGELDRAIEALRILWPPVAREVLPEDHLVIHLRSGDVFSENPNPLYGQPPLAFYKHVLSYRKWVQVTVVCEDNRHPLEGLIRDFSASLGISSQRQSGTLREDREFLRSARSIVSSRGTFVPAVIGMSDSAERVFSFGPVVGIHSSVSVIRVEDKKGDYWRNVCEGQWKNTEDQREMMLTYPDENLFFPD